MELLYKSIVKSKTSLLSTAKSVKMKNQSPTLLNIQTISRPPNKNLPPLPNKINTSNIFRI